MKKILTFCFLVFAIIGCVEKKDEKTSKTTSQENPIKNVVVIISDDHSIETIGAYGNQHIRTPNIDALAEEGMLFQNVYANSPICAPSWQSILSGKYPHATGVSLVFSPFPDHGNTTIAEVLQQEGFSTALIGKTHFNNHIWYDLYDGEFPTYGFDTIIEKSQHRQWLEKNPMPEIPSSIETRHSGNSAHKNPEYKPEAIYDSFATGTFYAREAIRFMQENQQKENPESGLLPHIFKYEPGEKGSGDDKIQAYNYRLCLTNVPENRLPFEKPEGYDSLNYEIMLRMYDNGYKKYEAGKGMDILYPYIRKSFRNYLQEKTPARYNCANQVFPTDCKSTLYYLACGFKVYHDS